MANHSSAHSAIVFSMLVCLCMILYALWYKRCGRSCSMWSSVNWIVFFSCYSIRRETTILLKKDHNLWYLRFWWQQKWGDLRCISCGKLCPLLINTSTGFCLLSWFSFRLLMVLAECLYLGSEPALICPTNHLSLLIASHSPLNKRVVGD